MKKIFLYVLLLASVLSSCLKHDNLYTGEGDDDSNKKKEEYDKNFPVKDIDPKQDWNMAAQMVVNVTVNYGGNGEYTIKIYSDNPRDPEVQAYLLGKYTVKDGSTNALAVDAVSGSQSVYVCCVDAANGSVMKKGEVENGKVNVGFGAAVKNRAVAGRAGEWQEFEVNPIADLVKPGEGVFQEGRQPKGNDVLTSYEFISTGPFTVYLVYGETDGNDEIGYYYYDLDSPGDIKNKLKREILINNLQVGNWIEYEGAKGGWGGNNWIFDPKKYPSGYPGNDVSIQELKGLKMRSHLHEINVPIRSRVGFYVKVGGSTYYSNGALNGGRIHSAVVKDSQNHPLYIGLEDNPDANMRDCNDVIFCISDNKSGNETPPEVVDPENPNTPDDDKPATWIIACEDLGSTGDYDFNDIVFGVSHVAGQEKVEVIPYAAGGTLPAHIYWNNEDLGEIHGLLGSASTATMINTNSKGKPGESIEIEVGSNFWMSSTNMGGFSLKIGETKVEIAAPGEGKVPQMICVPADWAWPKERTNIINAYPAFGEWGANYGISIDWWQNSTPGTVVQ